MKSELTRIAATLVTGDWASDCADDRERRHDLAHRLVSLKRRLGRLIYLASPYSHPDPQVRQYRYEQVLEATRLLMEQGHHIWAPIVYTHQLAEAGMATDWAYWRQLDEAMLVRCQELWVLLLDGWVASDGVQAEIQLAERWGLPRRYVRPEDLLDEHPIGCVCVECEEREVREAMTRGGFR